jgi:hypothetical protein
VAACQSSLLWDKACGLFTMVEDFGEFTVLTRVNCHVVDQSFIAQFFAHLKNALFIEITHDNY